MKPSLRVIFPILLFIAARSEFANCLPLPGLEVADKANNGSSTATGSTQLTSSSSSSSSLDASDATGDASRQETAPPPLIFPADSSVYKIVENDTALKILQARSARAEPPTSTPPPLASEGQKVQPAAGESATAGSKNNGTLTPAKSKAKDGDQKGEQEEEDDDDYDTENDDDLKEDTTGSDEDDDSSYDTEDVQPVDPLKEDGLEEQFGNKESHYPLVLDDSMIEMSAMRQEHIWIIMIGAVVVLALAAYIAMVLYRNRLEQRYGMRQRLVTEDDFYTNNDI